MMIFQALTTSFARGVYPISDRYNLRRSAFFGLIAFDQFVSEVANPERTRIWVGPQENVLDAEGCGLDVGYFRQSAVSVTLNWLRNLTDTMANQITAQQIAPIGTGDWVAVVTTDPSHATELAERLRQLGRGVWPLHQREITVANARLFLQLLPMTRSTPAE